MSAKELIAEAMKLPEEDRREIVEVLSESIEGPVDADYEAERDAELKRRVDALEAGTLTGMPWEEARRRIRGGDLSR